MMTPSMTWKLQCLTLLSATLVAAISSPAFSQVVNISGTILHSVTRAPLKGATVALISRAGFYDTTGLDGKYLLSSTVPVKNPVTRPQIASGGQLRGNTFEFHLEKRADVRVDIFSASGTKVKTIYSNRAAMRGSYRVDLASSPLSSGFYLIQFRNDSECRTFRYVRSAQGHNPIANGHAVEPGSVAKISAPSLDSLVIARSGFTSVKIPVQSYTGVFDTALQPLSNPEIAFSDMILSTAMGTSDAIPFDIVLTNIGGSNALSVRCSVATDDSFVTITQPIGAYNNITMQQTATNYSKYVLTVSYWNRPTTPFVNFRLYISDSWGGTWQDDFIFLMHPFAVNAQVVDDDNIPDSRGNGDHLITAGETVEFTPRLINQSGITITGVTGTLYSLTSGVAVQAANDVWAFGDFAPAAMNLPNYDYVFIVGNSVTFPSDTTRFKLYVTGNDGRSNKAWVVPIYMPTACTKPTVSALPTAKSVMAPATATFLVAATNTSSYQWQRAEPASPTTFSNVTAGSGGTAASYTTAGTSVAADNGSVYRCMITNNCGSDTTNPSVLTVTACSAPTISVQPAAKNVTAPVSATFTVLATGPNIIYQWQHAAPANPTSFSNVTSGTGGTTVSYTTGATAVGNDNGAVYRCVLTNVCGSVTTNSAILTVIASLSAPTITMHPESQTIAAGSSVVFTVAASGNPLPTYQWQKNGATISGATSASYTIPNVQPINEATYAVVVTNSQGSVTSSGAVLSLLGPCMPGPSGTANTADKVLIAKHLDVTCESQFSSTDGVITPFWASWNGDYISMNSADPRYARHRSATCPFSGAGDAAMVVRAAYSSTGVYLYFAVTDNSWVDPSIWSNDVVDVFLDPLSSAGIVDRLNWFNPTQWALTYFCKEPQVPMGNTAPVTAWNYRYYSELDVNMMDYPTAINNGAYGIRIEIIKIGTNQKTQEWYIPWDELGVTKTIAPGLKVGLAINYNDMDAGDGAEVNSLSWIGLCDPYCMADAGLWGDIELGAY